MTQDHTVKEQMLAEIKAAGSKGIRYSEIVEKIGITTNNVGPRLSRAMRDQPGDWRFVHKVERGLYVFKQGQPAEPLRPHQHVAPRPAVPDWDEVQTLHNGMVVLRGPDGELWLAKPLVDVTT